SKALADIALKQANSLFDRLKIYELQIQYYIAKNERKKAVDLGIYALKLINIELDGISPDVTDIEALADLPEMTEPTKIRALRILIATVSAAVIVAPDLLVPIASKMVNICILSGNSKLAPYAYGFHAWMLCSSLGEIETGYRFGKLAIQLLEKFNAKEIKCKVYQQFNVFVRHRKEPLENMKELVEAVQSGIEVGDIEYACYAAQDYCILQFFLGQNLEISLQEQKKYLQLIRRNQQDFSFSFASPWVQLVSNLLNQSVDRYSLIGNFFDETLKIPVLQETNDHISLFPLLFIKTYLNYLFGCYELAVDNAISAEKVQAGSNGFIYYPSYLFYFSLALLACESRSTSEKRQTSLDRVNGHQKQLGCWMNDAPFTYQHKYDLVQAEYHRVLREKLEAIELYDRAISGAKENGFTQEEALANEIAAKFYLDWGKEKVAAGYMQEAYYCYARWGAKAKINDLEQRYPSLLGPILERQKLGFLNSATITNVTQGTISPTTTATGEILDLATLMKASRTLSEDISLEGAVANLMQVVRENAGAETVALMLFTEQVLMLTAVVTAQGACQVEPIVVETSHSVPLSMIDQVKRSQKPLVLENASNETAYAGDIYIQQHQPQSVLCLPLLDHGKLIGILYLENNQVAGVFTSERVEILNLLCSQAAISLENARLYQKSQDYTEQLEQTQLQLVQSEKMASIGQLVSGVAHEINNPIGFISGNLDCATEYIQDLMDLLQLYQQGFDWNSETTQDKIEEIELDYLIEDLPEMLESMRQGTNRITEISKSMRTFSRSDTIAKVPFSIHQGIDSTLLILKHRLKANELRPEIKVVKNYDDLPEINCYPGQLNQVFMNILANAIDALDEASEGKIYTDIEVNNNCITISTRLSTDKKSAIVEIADNGPGMSEQVRSKIFDQGFTTKGVGKGTGLGMAISQQIIVEKHGGTIDCISALGQGTKFIITVPLS
ncbi:MAG: GAF domain-containing protein, partial [Okeania sp. SIO2D1]|nr:GAF domain-containing protein [Okeania sp. SIO2D1]